MACDEDAIDEVIDLADETNQANHEKENGGFETDVDAVQSLPKPKDNLRNQPTQQAKSAVSTGRN